MAMMADFTSWRSAMRHLGTWINWHLSEPDLRSENRQLAVSTEQVTTALDCHPERGRRNTFVYITVT